MENHKKIQITFLVKKKKKIGPNDDQIPYSSQSLSLLFYLSHLIKDREH